MILKVIWKSIERIFIFTQLKVINENFKLFGFEHQLYVQVIFKSIMMRFINLPWTQQHKKAFLLKCLESLISIYIIIRLLSFRRSIAGHLLSKLIYE